MKITGPTFHKLTKSYHYHHHYSDNLQNEKMQGDPLFFNSETIIDKKFLIL